MRDNRRRVNYRRRKGKREMSRRRRQEEEPNRPQADRSEKHRCDSLRGRLGRRGGSRASPVVRPPANQTRAAPVNHPRPEGRDGTGRDVYHVVRGRFGSKDVKYPRRCDDSKCTRRHWTAGGELLPAAGTPPRAADAARGSSASPYLPNETQVAELLTDLIQCSKGFVSALADSFGTDRPATKLMKRARTWSEVRGILEEQGVIGIGTTNSRRTQFWRTIQRLIDQEAREAESDSEVDLRVVLEKRRRTVASKVPQQQYEPQQRAGRVQRRHRHRKERT